MSQEFWDFLIIGYGNTLRSDDGIGYKIAQIVETWQLPKVRSLYVHQLTPELAADLPRAKTVIFVDAIEQTEQVTEIKLSEIAVNQEKLMPIHASNPQYLVNLTHQLYGQKPLVYWLLIPVINFDFGEELSSIALEKLGEALREIKQLILFTTPT